MNWSLSRASIPVWHLQDHPQAPHRLDAAVIFSKKVSQPRYHRKMGLFGYFDWGNYVDHTACRCIRL